MLWLVVPVSRQPAFVHPWGATACFFLLDGKGNGWGERRRTGGGGGACSSLPLHYMWLTYFSSVQQRRGRELGGVQGEITG